MQDLVIKCIMVNFTPQLVLPQQKEHCASVANDLIQTATNEPDFLKKFITGDELWENCVKSQGVYFEGE